MNRRSFLFGVAITLGLLVLITTGVALKTPVTAFDLWVTTLLPEFSSHNAIVFFFTITKLGGYLCMSVATAGVAFLLLMLRQKAYALGLLITVGGAEATAYILKLITARARPEDIVVFIKETTFAFPSGHATGVVALYGFIIYALWMLLPNKPLKIVGILGSIGIILSVSLSRLYLGVHYPSDVIAGALLGFLWLLIGVRISRPKRI